MSAGGTGGSAGGGNDAGDASTCPAHCSADLHQVLDCNDAVLNVCPQDQGCDPGGSCVAACDAAVANGSTFGCSFYSAVPGALYGTRGSCFAALLTNVWTVPISITAELGGSSLSVGQIARTPVGRGQTISYASLTNGTLAPGKVAILFLSAYASGDGQQVPCPSGITPGVSAISEIDGTGTGSAFHITTTAPVAAYDIYPFGGAASTIPSATLLIPTSAWGKNYVAADAYRADPNLASVNGFPFVQIVALENNTNVTISPTADIVSGSGVAGTLQGQPHTYALNAGQVVQFMQPEELSGSPISADKPIGVWGGSSCMNIPVGTSACDSGHQELVPVSLLGHRYVGVAYRDRVTGVSESIPYTLVGSADGTTLTYDPAAPPGAPTTIGSGQTAEFLAGAPFVVQSQDAGHPFYVAAHMTGFANLASAPNNDGDPEYVTVVPLERYLSSYAFVTDPTYGTTHLVFTRAKGNGAIFNDVTLDCIGAVTGWRPVDRSDTVEYARVDLVTNGVPQGSCDAAVHTATSKTPFGITVWGWDSGVSYAYPAGMAVGSVK
jgi:hypothetical protein